MSEKVIIAIKLFMKIIYLILSSILSFSYNTVLAQKFDHNDLIPPVTVNLKSGKPVDTKKILLFSIFISVNDKGMVDSVYFSKIKEPWVLASEINLQLIIDFYKIKNVSAFQEYKNCLIMKPVISRNLDDILASYLPALTIDFQNLFLRPESDKEKKLILSKPIINGHFVDY